MAVDSNTRGRCKLEDVRKVQLTGRQFCGIAYGDALTRRRMEHSLFGKNHVVVCLTTGESAKQVT